MSEKGCNCWYQRCIEGDKKSKDLEQALTEAAAETAIEAAAGRMAIESAGVAAIDVRLSIHQITIFAFLYFLKWAF